jgi:gluconolactonase
MNRLLSALLLASLAACSCPGGMSTSYPSIGSIEVKDPRFNELIAPGAKMEVLAGGFDWTEGPLWIKDGGYLIFSVIPPNKIVKWKEGVGASIYLRPSGLTTGQDLRSEPGSNGLLLDPQGRLVLCQHGDRRVARMNAPLSAPKPDFATVVDKHDGKKLNSPNDAAYHSSGALYFTDPPYGLVKRMDDPTKEIPYQGVYRVGTDGAITLLTKEVTRPNGIAFSPDEKTLYVASSDPDKAVWHAYPVNADGTLGAGRIFADFTPQFRAKAKGLPDGLKVDVKGNLFATGPGGVLVFAPDGTHLGTLNTGQNTSNCAWGDDGSTLYITADQYLVRIRTLTKGNKF